MAYESGSSEDVMQPNRREFIQLLIASLAMPWLPGCGLAPAPVDEEAQSKVATTFDVLRDLVARLRRSPDHLPGQRDRLVAARDWRAIHAFVRDQIETWPTGAEGFMGDNVRSVRWGSRVTLRGGAGTPREKADLLVSALTEAGFSARVMQANLHYDADAVTRILQPRLREFAPPVDAETLVHWRKILGRAGASQRPPLLDPGERALDTLLARVQAAIKDAPGAWSTAPGFDPRWRTGLAVVVVDTPEGRFLLNPVDPAAAPTTEGIEALRSAGVPVGLLEVEVSLEAATADDPRKRHVLVAGQWAADQVAGRTLVVATPPTVAPADWGSTRLDDIQTYLPVLRLIDAAADPALADLGVQGVPFTRRAERLVTESDGALSIDGVVLGAAPADAIARVHALRMRVLGQAQGEATLAVDAVDADGKPVQELTANAFAMKVGADARGFLLLANRPRLEVAILIDQSLSMPADYLGELGQAWVESTRAQVLAVAPDAVIRVVPTGSRLWTSLAAESARGADLLVYLTDGHVDDSPDDALRSTLAAGPPALVVGVRDDRRGLLGMLAAATNGKQVDVAEPQLASAAIADALTGHAVTTYRIRLSTQGLAPGGHAVVLATRDGRATSEVMLEIPEAMGALPPQMCGLYLTVKVGGVRVERTLAGLDARVAGQIAPTRGDLEAVGTALLSGACVVFEGAAPSLATWLDDVVSSQLPLERVLAAEQKDGATPAFERMASVFQPLPALAWQAGLLPVSGKAGEPLTYHTGLRAVLLASQQVQADRRIARIDMLPVSRFATAAQDPAQARTITLRRTTHLALAEAAHYSTSTVSMLQDKSLALLRTDTPAIRALEADAGRRWYEALRGTTGDWIVGDRDAGPLAFFQVSRRTGELLAVLPDGSGGGSDVQQLLAFMDKLQTVMDLYEAANWSPSGAIHGAPGLSAVAEWGQVLARLYAAATVTVAMVGVGGHDEQSRRIIKRLACQAADIVAKGPFGGTLITERMRDLVGVLVGSEAGCG